MESKRFFFVAQLFLSKFEACQQTWTIIFLSKTSTKKLRFYNGFWIFHLPPPKKTHKKNTWKHTDTYHTPTVAPCCTCRTSARGHGGEEDAPIPGKSRCHFTTRSLCTTHLQKGPGHFWCTDPVGWIEWWLFEAEKVIPERNGGGDISLVFFLSPLFWMEKIFKPSYILVYYLDLYLRRVLCFLNSWYCWWFRNPKQPPGKSKTM